MKLREARAKKLLSVRELAQKSGASVSTIRNAEQGIYTPSLRVVRQIAEALGVDPNEVDELRAAIEATARGREKAG